MRNYIRSEAVWFVAHTHAEIAVTLFESVERCFHPETTSSMWLVQLTRLPHMFFRMILMILAIVGRVFLLTLKMIFRAIKKWLKSTPKLGVVNY